MENQEAKTVAPSFDASGMAPITDRTNVSIIDPVSKKATGISIEVLSRDSDVYKGLQRKQMNKRFKGMSRRIQLQLTAEETEEEAMDLLVACTVGWTGMGWKGDPALAFTPANVRMVYEGVPTIKEQVDDAINDRGNFLKR